MASMSKEKSEEIKKEQERQAIEEKSDWQWLLADERGRRIVFRMLERTGVFRCSFQGNALNTAFSEGLRNEGIYLMERIGRFAPEQMAQIFRMQNTETNLRDVK